MRFIQIFKEIRTLGFSIKLLIEKFDVLQRALASETMVVPLPDDELINVKYAAQILNVSTKTVERYRAKGTIGYTKPAGLVSYSKNEVTALAKSIILRSKSNS